MLNIHILNAGVGRASSYMGMRSSQHSYDSATTHIIFRRPKRFCSQCVSCIQEQNDLCLEIKKRSVKSNQTPHWNIFFQIFMCMKGTVLFHKSLLIIFLVPFMYLAVQLQLAQKILGFRKMY